MPAQQYPADCNTGNHITRTTANQLNVANCNFRFQCSFHFIKDCFTGFDARSNFLLCYIRIHIIFFLIPSYAFNYCVKSLWNTTNIGVCQETYSIEQESTYAFFEDFYFKLY